MLGGKRTHYITLSGTCIHPPGSNAPAPPGRCVGETGTRADAGRACWEGREVIKWRYRVSRYVTDCWFKITDTNTG